METPATRIPDHDKWDVEWPHLHFYQWLMKRGDEPWIDHTIEAKRRYLTENNFKVETPEDAALLISIHEVYCWRLWH